MITMCVWREKEGDQKVCMCVWRDIFGESEFYKVGISTNKKNTTVNRKSPILKGKDILNLE